MVGDRDARLQLCELTAALRSFLDKHSLRDVLPGGASAGVATSTVVASDFHLANGVASSIGKRYVLPPRMVHNAIRTFVVRGKPSPRLRFMEFHIQPTRAVSVNCLAQKPSWSSHRWRLWSSMLIPCLVKVQGVV